MVPQTMVKRVSLFIYFMFIFSAASAHPLGIFSTNRYARIEVGAAAIRIVYVIDVAEIPAIQEISGIDRNEDGILDPQERQEYAGNRITELMHGLSLSVDGKELPLALSTYELSFVPGQ